MDARKVLFSGEMQLCRWSESSVNGATVTMWVHPEDLEAFKLMKVRTGKNAGQRLGVAIIQINDDEAIVEHAAAPTPAPTAAPKPAPSAGPKGPTVRIGDFGRCAVMWCQRADFRAWAASTSGLPIEDQDDAKEFILDECGVTAVHGTAASRKHLDLHEFSRAFLDRVFYPFSEYAKANGIDLTRKP